MGGKVSWGAITIKKPDLDLSEWENAVVKDGKLDPVTTQVFADWLEEHEDSTSRGWRIIAEKGHFPEKSNSYKGEFLWANSNWDTAKLKQKVIDKLSRFVHKYDRSDHNGIFEGRYYPTPFAALCDLAQALAQGD